MKSLKQRIRRVYRVLECRDTDHGALIWFARRARVAPWTVSRWVTGRRPFRGPALALLESLETLAVMLPKPRKAP